MESLASFANKTANFLRDIYLYFLTGLLTGGLISIWFFLTGILDRDDLKDIPKKFFSTGGIIISLLLLYLFGNLIFAIGDWLREPAKKAFCHVMKEFAKELQIAEKLISTTYATPWTWPALAPHIVAEIKNFRLNESTHNAYVERYNNIFQMRFGFAFAFLLAPIFSFGGSLLLGECNWKLFFIFIGSATVSVAGFIVFFRLYLKNYAEFLERIGVSLGLSPTNSLELYFAYGSNLSFDQMKERCPSAETFLSGTLENHKLIFPRESKERWQGGVAGIMPATGKNVEGALYLLTKGDLLKLDGFEGVDKNHYRRERMRIRISKKRSIFAWVYIAIGKGEFKPSEKYMTRIIEGAKFHNLSESYLRFLSGIELKKADPPQK